MPKSPTSIEPVPTPLVVRWPRTGRSVPRARMHLRAALVRWELADLVETAELVLSELLTNAVRHAGTPSDRQVETRYGRLPEGGVRIEVHDAGDDCPHLRDVALTDTSGRGLHLVAALTQGEWGTEPRNGPGKRVWAHVRRT